MAEGKPFIKYGLLVCIILVAICTILNFIMMFYLYKLKQSEFENKCTNAKVIDQLRELQNLSKGLLVVSIAFGLLIIIFGVILIPFSKNSD
jgi:hypothetical protein